MTDQELLTELQIALLEQPDGGQSWPSEVWDRDEVLLALNGAVDAILVDTELQIQRVELPVLAPAQGIVTLPSDWLATAHCVWRGSTNRRTPLGPADTTSADLAEPTWELVPGTPYCYADLDAAAQPVSGNLRLRLIPRPDEDGTLELMYVPQPAALNGAGATIGVVNEVLSGVKYRTLARLLTKVGRMNDPERAQYCEQRYQLTRVVTEILLGGWS